jgi:Zn-dependent protease with chaperone function
MATASGVMPTVPNAAARTIGAELFVGPESLRMPGEWRSLWFCILGAPLVIGAARVVFPGLSVSEFVLLIAAGLAFVSVSRGRLLGSSIRIEGRQLPEIAELTRDLAMRLGMPTPQVFVRDDPFVPIAAVGVGEPYALIISSQYYEHLRRGELAFLIARELAHIAAGHTRLTSLLSASGRENPVVALVFGAWLRRTEFTADRVGLLCSDGLSDALGAIAITTFHAIGRHVDLDVLAEQRSELNADPTLRFGEWMSPVPYATNRLEALRQFDASAVAQNWRTRLRNAPLVAIAPVEDRSGEVTRRDCAPLVRRATAGFIDFNVISAIVETPVGENITKVKVDMSDPDIPDFIKALVAHVPHLTISFTGFTTVLAFFIYSAILVGLGGQTLGMTVMELRVVTKKFGRPTIVQSIWRYIVALGSLMTVVPAFAGLFMRVMPQDRLSGTRVIRGRKAT